MLVQSRFSSRNALHSKYEKCIIRMLERYLTWLREQSVINSRNFSLFDERLRASGKILCQPPETRPEKSPMYTIDRARIILVLLFYTSFIRMFHATLKNTTRSLFLSPSLSFSLVAEIIYYYRFLQELGNSRIERTHSAA